MVTDERHSQADDVELLYGVDIRGSLGAGGTWSRGKEAHSGDSDKCEKDRKRDKIGPLGCDRRTDGKLGYSSAKQDLSNRIKLCQIRGWLICRHCIWTARSRMRTPGNERLESYIAVYIIYISGDASSLTEAVIFFPLPLGSVLLPVRADTMLREVMSEGKCALSINPQISKETTEHSLATICTSILRGYISQ